MTPGRKYSSEELVRIIIHRKWVIVILFALGVASAMTVSRWLPNKYRSESLVIAVPQQISDSYVKQSGTAKIEDRLPTISQQVLSRARLERIIDDFDLYADQRRKRSMEEVIQRMRADIDVKIEGSDSTGRGTDRLLRISYVSLQAKTAQQVAERLTSLIIDESLRERENLAQDTNAFLETQLEDAKARLIAHEKKLEVYRRQYSGQLPNQAAANLQVIQNTQLQLQALSEATDRARERRLLVERQLADLQSSDPVVAAASAATATPEHDGAPGESTVQQLEAARTRLRLLQLRDKAKHPDVRALQRTILDLEAKLDAEASHPVVQTSEKPVTPSDALRQKRVRDLNGQRDDIEHELQEKQQQENRLRGIVTEYQAKLDAQPSRESDLVELMRDYTTLQNTYQELLTKREQSKMAANIERRSIGEQFRLLEPARVPERPFSPNRLLIHAGGAASGLALGLMLVAFLEYRESGLRYEDDVTRLFDLPVLALVPTMRSAAERQAVRRRRHVLVGVAAVVVLLGAATVLALWRV